jgi:hypothetical protein
MGIIYKKYLAVGELFQLSMHAGELMESKSLIRCLRNVKLHAV